MKRAREYRADARATLNHNIFSSEWLYSLLVVFVAGLILAALGATGIGAIATLIIAGPIEFGLIRTFLRVIRKEDATADIAHLFDGFREKFKESLLTSLLTALYTFLWSLLLFIPGIIKSYSYSAALYLVHERGLEGNEAITESRRIMNGNKWKLFCLDLSFIGWYIVGSLCFGVGTLWVETYHTVAKTHFFEDLLKESNVIDVK